MVRTPDVSHLLEINQETYEPKGCIMKLKPTVTLLAIFVLGGGCSTSPKQEAARSAAVTAAPVSDVDVVEQNDPPEKEVAPDPAIPDRELVDRDDDRFSRDPLRGE